jgi:hypothetical protein
MEHFKCFCRNCFVICLDSLKPVAGFWIRKKDKNISNDKRQDRALKICPVGKFSEGDSMQGWIKTKVWVKITVLRFAF